MESTVTTDPQRSYLSNPRSSPQSNFNHYGDNNESNHGIIGDGSGNFMASGDNNWQLNITQVTKAEGETELDRLLDRWISRDALHDSLRAPPECHPGTRKTPCKAIEEWMLDSAGSPLLWLYGPAGVGKSVIAKTISSYYHTRVVATFFSTSSDRSAATLFPTLAWQLAKKVPETEQHIVAAIKGNCSLQTSQIERQFDQLIVQPLKQCKSKVPLGLVIVIDGVDECVDEDMQKQFLGVLKRAGEMGDMPLRFLICSRPEPRIRAILEQIVDNDAPAQPHTIHKTIPITPGASESSPPLHSGNMDQPAVMIASTKQQTLSLRSRAWIKIEPYLPDVSVVKAQLKSLRRWKTRRPRVLPSDAWKLYRAMLLGVDKVYSASEIPDELDKLSPHRVISRIQIGLSEESKDDIRIYLTDKFKAIRQLENDAIAPEDIEDLVMISCGQFLYASTIVKLLDDPGWCPKRVLVLSQCQTWTNCTAPSLIKHERLRRMNHGGWVASMQTQN